MVHSKNCSTAARSALVSGLVPHTPYKCCVTTFNSRGGRERTQCSSVWMVPGKKHLDNRGTVFTKSQ